MAAKILQKFLEKLLLAFTGYEVGKNIDDHESSPNITIIVPSQNRNATEDKTGIQINTTGIIIVLAVIIVILIALLVIKHFLSKFSKRVINRTNAIQNGIPLQQINVQRRSTHPGAQPAEGLHVCP